MAAELKELKTKQLAYEAAEMCKFNGSTGHNNSHNGHNNHRNTQAPGRIIYLRPVLDSL